MSLGMKIFLSFIKPAAINIFSGNSVMLGLNGRPIIQGYRVSLGCFPPPQIISGGTF
jgi:hypothetical protein